MTCTATPANVTRDCERSHLTDDASHTRKVPMTETLTRLAVVAFRLAAGIAYLTLVLVLASVLFANGITP